MKKKQRNRKVILQNKRNHMINRRYISTIKTLSRLLCSQKKNKKKKELKNSQSSQSLLNLLYSFIDKAVKKNVLHSNTAARKKSSLSRFV
jgi:small subunit ribosomal protein S20